MNPEQMDEFFNRFSATLGRELSSSLQAAQRAADEAYSARAASDRAALVSGLRGLSRSSQPFDRVDKKASEKEDLTASILKTQQKAVEFVTENTFNPEEIQIHVWKDDVKHSLRSKQCEDVIEYAGLQCYKRQSNDLYLHLKRFETEYRERHSDRGALSQPSDGRDKHDRLRMYFNGKAELQGSHVTTWRKMLVTRDPIHSSA